MKTACTYGIPVTKIGLSFQDELLHLRMEIDAAHCLFMSGGYPSMAFCSCQPSRGKKASTIAGFTMVA